MRRDEYYGVVEAASRSVNKAPTQSGVPRVVGGSYQTNNIYSTHAYIHTYVC